ncbi:VacJ family lipoprotein [Aquabacterium sp.]|uniref:MlaA family lipoprotein n=1 Tax=Aquabacterium sp. TaxID=1872578 RepID=UPI0024886528|nr:VacJ family lipoprotein [Aquabacterium sp.]MDI1259770.1 VacJ family lipoprotein [Aquabacterium sp.]
MNPRPVEWAAPVQTSTWAKGLGGLLIVSTTLLQGCATRQNPDPLEVMNRKVFSFNQALDDNLLKPVATGYKAVTPQPVRTAISNFGGNFKDLWSAINLFLQGHPGQGATQIMRVSVNTTFGLAGLIDMATPMRLERQNEDFGQTLGVWGVKPGAYIVWPILGPSTLRDSVSIPGDLYFSPRLVINDDEAAMGVSILQVINARASVLDVTNLLTDVALDPYSFVRDAYLQRRQSQVYNGEPPEEDEEDYDSEPAVDPVAPQSKIDSDAKHWPDITVAELQGLRADEFVR